MKAKRALLHCCTWLAVAAWEPSSAQPPAGTVDAKRPPSVKEVLRHLMRNLDVLLTVDESCSGVGTTDDDRTIGDYLSGFFAEHANKDSWNWLEVTAVPATTSDGKAAWKSSVMVMRKDAHDEMSWGVGFLVTDADRVVLRQSFRCLGSG